jgi:hypothetical protein
MMRAPIKGGLLLTVLLLAACQTYEQPVLRAQSAMDGDWASTDGVFVANFQNGRFTSRFTQTNEILAQGTYTVAGSNVSMQWISVQAQEQRSAHCSIVGAGIVTCNQAGGGSFGLQRTA